MNKKILLVCLALLVFVASATFVAATADVNTPDGYKINDNLTIDKPDEVAVGLFGLVDSASIKNLTLKNAKVTGNEYVGALAGIVEESNIERVVSVNGDVSGLYYVGGLVGAFGKDDYNTTKIKMIASTGNVLGINIVGGVIGYLKACVENVFSVSVVKGKKTVGGIIGSYSYSRCEIGDDGYRIPQVFHAYSASIEKSPDASGISGNHSYKYMWDVCLDETRRKILSVFYRYGSRVAWKVSG